MDGTCPDFITIRCGVKVRSSIYGGQGLEPPLSSTDYPMVVGAKSRNNSNLVDGLGWGSILQHAGTGSCQMARPRHPASWVH